MTETRSKTFIHLIGEPEENFSSRVLPTTLDVLKVYFYQHNKNNLSQKDAVKAVVLALSDIWCKARIPTSEQRSIIRKLESLLDRYRNICRNKGRPSSTQQSKEAEFSNSINSLFDIAHHDAFNIITIDEDRLFLIDQRLERKFGMGTVDTELAKKEEKADKRKLQENERQRKEEHRKRKATESVVLLSSSSESDGSSDEDVYCPPVTTPSTSQTDQQSSKRKLTATEIIPKCLASALDRTNVSDRKAAYIIAAAAQVYSPNVDDVAKLPLSFSSIRRSREKHRAEFSNETKANFLPEIPLVIHMDGKLLPAISGGPKKEDRVAILVTGFKTEKLLAIPKVAQGTGEQVAQAALAATLDWNLKDRIIGVSFDTTASNTGRLNGACVLLENKLDKKLLWFACRHHVHEVLCGDVFKAVFGPTSGPNVLLFRRFQDYWPNIDQASYTPCNDSRIGEGGELENLKIAAVKFSTNILSGEKGALPREDYRELVELVLIFLGQIPSRGVHFRVPGAFHHARWMAKLIYVLKIYLFQSQFKLTKHEKTSCLEFGLFVALIYVQSWITSPNSCDAPINDLHLIQALTAYKKTSKIIATAGLKAISRHLWYLSEEMVPLCLFSDMVSVQSKCSIVAQLQGNPSTDGCRRSVRYDTSTADKLSGKEIESFIGPASHFFFDALHLDASFLKEDVEKWEELSSYKQAVQIVNALKVVNDSAERGVALATTFNSSITKHEDQKQYLYQVVESHRKQFPKPNKQLLFGKRD